MKSTVITFTFLSWMAGSTAYLYNPYMFRYSFPYYHHGSSAYPNHYSPFFTIPTHTLYSGNSLAPYFANSYNLPQINVLAEAPFLIKNNFTVVPIHIVAKESINCISNALIMQASREKPTLTVKTEGDMLIECIPAVKVFLEKPLIINGLRSSVPFPSEIVISHGGYKIPIRVGAVMAPVPHDVYISGESPYPVDFVYAVPTKPFLLDYVNNDKDVIVNIDNQAVIVENEPDAPPEKNVTVLEFPDTEAEPSFDVDEEDEELVNRNPPMGVIPAGIVQSTQPIVSIQTFQNSKESPILTTLKEEAAKNHIKAQTLAAIVPSF